MLGSMVGIGIGIVSLYITSLYVTGTRVVKDKFSVQSNLFPIIRNACSTYQFKQMRIHNNNNPIWYVYICLIVCQAFPCVGTYMHSKHYDYAQMYASTTQIQHICMNLA